MHLTINVLANLLSGILVFGSPNGDDAHLVGKSFAEGGDLLQALPRIRAASTLCQSVGGVHYDQKWNVVCISGEIDPEGRLEARVKELPLKDRVLVVLESPGGGLMSSLRLVEFLETYRYDAIVTGICASACSQFLFLGAQRKYVYRDGVLAFHGGPIPDREIQAMAAPADVKANLRSEQEAFRKFYTARSIDINLVSRVPSRYREGVVEHTEFWVPTYEEIKNAGVADVWFVDTKIME